MDFDQCISAEHCLDLPWWSLRIMMFCPSWIQQIGCSGANTRQLKDAIVALEGKMAWWEQIGIKMEKAGGGPGKEPRATSLPTSDPATLALTPETLGAEFRTATKGVDFRVWVPDEIRPSCVPLYQCLTSPSFSVNGNVKAYLKIRMKFSWVMTVLELTWVCVPGKQWLFQKAPTSDFCDPRNGLLQRPPPDVT